MPTKPNLPIEVILSKGKFHISKREIAERREKEPKPVIEGIAVPECLTTEVQRKAFWKYCEQLKNLKIMGESDCEILARYVLELEEHRNLTRQLRSQEVQEDFELHRKVLIMQKKVSETLLAIEKELGFTPRARANCVVPKSEREEKVNRFAKFGMDEKASGNE